MSPFAGAPSTTERPEFAVKAILAGCHLDIDRARRDIVREDGFQAEMESITCRLMQVAERLENAAGALDQVLALAVGPVSISLAADAIAREADHRIKNNLQSVISLLRQQAQQAKTAAVQDALIVASARVEAMAQLHAALHDAASGSRGAAQALDLSQYLGRLCTALGQALGVDGTHRKLNVQVEPQSFPSASAQMLGLMVTELVSNALLHAFPTGAPGTVSVTGSRRADGSYLLCIEDNGKGLPSGFDLRLRPSGFGLRMACMMADQLRAKLAAERGAGTRFTLALPATIQA
ncbi:MAG: two-component sensor histidine kinase [Roseomonas sp.]|nr:two-component sensor histidine kinase [Roseomonas sp.]